ncbi:hypothetical protein BDN72DRAFT_892822 [Pluteus cervinus]|uniref:Uncharacterized protein n=1 Tax=Pluteus cervinus TaxID=181527 RepID=A0ACD3B920_9AGAR|nr:hypothetical protein BDN72DRAFT_892822 [Pluteus cervinus]
MPPSSAPPNFCADELQRALKEQAFGVATFAMTEATPLHAAASVTLLEECTITVSLSRAGYAVDPTTSPGMGPEAVFESLENLLQTVSPLYQRKLHSTLLQRLEKLS